MHLSDSLDLPELGVPDGCPDVVERPLPMPAALAGQRELGGWMDDRGEFFPAGYGAHIRIAFLLRETGDGPEEPWAVEKSRWLMVRANGEVVALPGRFTQAQHDSLGELLIGAPAGIYRSTLLDSLRLLRELEPCR